MSYERVESKYVNTKFNIFSDLTNKKILSDYLSFQKMNFNLGNKG